jgi:hypothetical protein
MMNPRRTLGFHLGGGDEGEVMDWDYRGVQMKVDLGPWCRILHGWTPGAGRSHHPDLHSKHRALETCRATGATRVLQP